MDERTSYGRQITKLAAEHRERVAIVFAAADGSERETDWRELDARSNQAARLLASRGVTQGSMVAVALTNSPEHFFAVIGAWKLGATVLPMRWDLPARERDRLLGLAKASLVVGNWPDAGDIPLLSQSDIEASVSLDDALLPDAIPSPINGIASSGSTGSPKLIIAPGQGLVNLPAVAGLKTYMKLDGEITQLVASPLYHINGFMAHEGLGLHDSHKLVLMEHFVAERAVELIERHRVDYTIMVPIMLQRIARIPGVEAHDFSSLRAVSTGAAPLPAWVARKWFELVGPEHFFTGYGGSERIGSVIATGVEWLSHEGTSGKPVSCELRIVDAEGRALPAGEIGDIYMKNSVVAEPFDYVGSVPPKRTADGFATYGDMGWVDEDGYLYIADRRVDLIVSGGANIYPAEVESAISEHPDVADVVVVGLPDEEWGRRVHAIVEPRIESTPPSSAALKDHCRVRLASYKVPKSIEFVAKIQRSAAGKLNRNALAAERIAS